MTTGPETPPPDPHEPPGQQPVPPGQQPGPAYGGPPPYQQPGQPGQPGQPPYPQAGASYPAAPAPLRPDEEKLWAIGAHLGPLLLGFIAPLVVWLVYKDRSPWLDRQGKEALNFQLTLLIAYVVSFVLIFVLVGILLMAVVWIGSLVLMIVATVKVSSFEDYRYPLTIRFIK